MVAVPTVKRTRDGRPIYGPKFENTCFRVWQTSGREEVWGGTLARFVPPVNKVCHDVEVVVDAMSVESSRMSVGSRSEGTSPRAMATGDTGSSAVKSSATENSTVESSAKGTLTSDTEGSNTENSDTINGKWILLAKSWRAATQKIVAVLRASYPLNIVI